MKFERVDSPEKVEAWRKFAQTFNHDMENPILPIILVTNDHNQAIGHFQALTQPIIFPAIHPSVTKREFKDAADAIISYFTIASMSPQFPNGVAFFAIDKKNGFPQPVLDKLGIKPTGFELYKKLP